MTGQPPANPATAPTCERAVVFTWDALGRLATCTEHHPTSGEPERVSRYLYDRDGHTVFKALPGGTVEEKKYDTRGRTTAQHTSAPGELIWPGSPGLLPGGATFPGTRGAWITKHFYQYDNAGNVCLITEETPAAGDSTKALPDRVITNTYDGTYRLLEEKVFTDDTTPRTETTRYTFDKAGNRISMTRDFGAPEELGLTTYEYGNPGSSDAITGGPSNQVRVLKHWTDTLIPAVDYSVQYRYNPYGCRSLRWVNAGAPVSTMPGSGVDELTWDRENRLTASNIAAAAPPGVDRTPGDYTFRYDHRTRRLVRSSPSASALISFSGGLSVQEWPGPSPSDSSSSSFSSSSSNPSGPLVEYVRGSDYGGGIGGILYTIRGGQASCQHYNSRGDVIAKSAADDTAAIAWTAAYLAFGTRPEEKGTNPDPHRANTKEEDGTGLLNEGHRYRCLETGMFISRDPAGFVDGPNLYAYVLQNPWTSFDPEGLQGDISPYTSDSPMAEGFRRAGASEAAILHAQVEGAKVALPIVVGVGVSILTGGIAAPFVASAGITGATASTTVAVIAGATGSAATQITSNAMNDVPLSENVGSAAVTGGLFAGVLQTVGNAFTAFRQGMAQVSEKAAQANQLMRSTANANQTAKTGVAAGIVDDAGVSGAGVSDGAATKLNQTPAPLDPTVRAGMGSNPNFGGGCAEPQAASALKTAGGTTRGAVMVPGNIRAAGNPKHAQPRPMCSTCAPMARKLGIIDLAATTSSPYFSYYGGMSGPSGVGAAFANSLRGTQNGKGKRRR